MQPHYFDVLGTIAIGIARPATGRVGSDETLARARAEMQTVMTHLGGIGRRDKIEYHAGQCRLVRDKLPQLEKGPTVPAAAFSLRPRLLVRTLPYASQIFQGQCRIDLSGSRDKRFGNAMIGVPLESSLRPRQPVQELAAAPSGTRRSCGAGALVPFEALRLKAAHRRVKRSRQRRRSSPSQRCPALVWAISVRPRSTPSTSVGVRSVGTGTLTWIWTA
jgi:hypothetical protein